LFALFNEAHEALRHPSQLGEILLGQAKDGPAGPDFGRKIIRKGCLHRSSSFGTNVPIGDVAPILGGFRLGQQVPFGTNVPQKTHMGFSALHCTPRKSASALASEAAHMLAPDVFGDRRPDAEVRPGK
jgi:hypothetical protein